MARTRLRSKTAVLTRRRELHAMARGSRGKKPLEELYAKTVAKLPAEVRRMRLGEDELVDLIVAAESGR